MVSRDILVPREATNLQKSSIYWCFFNTVLRCQELRTVLCAFLCNTFKIVSLFWRINEIPTKLIVVQIQPLKFQNIWNDKLSTVVLEPLELH